MVYKPHLLLIAKWAKYQLMQNWQNISLFISQTLCRIEEAGPAGSRRTCRDNMIYGIVFYRILTALGHLLLCDLNSFCEIL